MMCDHNPRESAMVVTHRDDAGRPTVWCDPCLVPLITALNDGGVTTSSSCCGHGRSPGWVMLTDGRDLLITTDHATTLTLIAP